jgi:hypothetical protein
VTTSDDAGGAEIVPRLARHLRPSVAVRPRQRGWQFDLAVSHWKLTANGEDAASRLAFIVATLRKLKEEDRLAPAQEKWLPETEAQLAKLR